MNQIFSQTIFANSLENSTDYFIGDSTSELLNIILSSLQILFVLSVILNVTVIVSIVLMKKFHQINILILNLSVADLMHTMSIPMFIIQMSDHEYVTTLTGCRMFFFSDFVSMSASAFTVAALSVERYHQIVYCKNHVDTFSNKFKTFIILVFLVLVWSLTVAFVLPFTLSLDQHLDKGVVCYSRWREISISIFFTMEFIFIFLIPYAFILIASIRLLCFLKEWLKRFNQNVRLSIAFSKNSEFSLILSKNSIVESHSNPNEKSQLVANRKRKKTRRDRIQRKSTRTVLAIVFLFLLQWMPMWFVEITLALNLNLNEVLMKHLVFLSTAVAYTNAISNPIIYMLSTCNFKIWVLKLFKRFY